MAKQISVKSYTSADVYVKTIQDASFVGFTKNINGGLGSLALRLARKIDTFNTNSDVSLGNIIRIYIDDRDGTNVLVYTGYVEEQNPCMDGITEYVDIVCYGMATRFGQDILKTGQRTTLYTDTTAYIGTASSSSVAELSNVVKEIIDYFLTNNISIPISYAPGTASIESTGQAIRYTFTAQTYYEALEACRKVAPNNWYWFMGANGVIYFKGKPTTPTHTFMVGKNIKSIKVNKSARQVRNILLLNNGSTSYRKYEGDTSVGSYGRRTTVEVDSGFGDTATMDSYGSSFINENKDPMIRVELEVLDNNGNDSNKGYDIESISPGDTCQISNLAGASTLLNENMHIVEVEWTLDKARVVISLNEFDFDKFMIQLRKDVDEEQKGASFPSWYTEVS